ncbi:hypothetical protein D3C81_2296580 [compost metagenome]
MVPIAQVINKKKTKKGEHGEGPFAQVISQDNDQRNQDKRGGKMEQIGDSSHNSFDQPGYDRE